MFKATCYDMECSFQEDSGEQYCEYWEEKEEDVCCPYCGSELEIEQY